MKYHFYLSNNEMVSYCINLHLTSWSIKHRQNIEQRVIFNVELYSVNAEIPLASGGIAPGLPPELHFWIESHEVPFLFEYY